MQWTWKLEELKFDFYKSSTMEYGGVQKLGQKVCERGMIHVLANASNSKS